MGLSRRPIWFDCAFFSLFLVLFLVLLFVLFFASAPIKSYKKSNLWVSSFYFLDFSRAFSGAFSRALYIYVRMCAHIETYGNIS